MFEHLIEREREENFRTSKRRLKFPDGNIKTVEAYRLIWTWYDRIKAHEFGPNEEEILTLALETHESDGCPLDIAIGRAVEAIVQRFENWPEGFDFTDDTIAGTIAKRRMNSFAARKSGKS